LHRYWGGAPRGCGPVGGGGGGGGGGGAGIEKERKRERVED
jgi:hypothetical protein